MSIYSYLDIHKPGFDPGITIQKAAENSILNHRWNPLNYHAVQQAFWICPARYQICPAGRRSGKTEIGKRKLVKAACGFHKHHNGRFIAAVYLLLI